MGQDRIGAPAIVDSYRPGAFEMRRFATDHDDQRGDRRDRREIMLKNFEAQENSASSAGSALNVVAITSALRRCREPVPARVAVAGDCPVRVTTDRRGFAGGAVVKSAGPWRTSGEWWAGGPPPIQPYWNRDEWDVALSDGAVYRIFRDRETDGWFIDAIVD